MSNLFLCHLHYMFCVSVVVTSIEVKISVELSVLIGVACGCICVQFVITQMFGQQQLMYAVYLVLRPLNCCTAKCSAICPCVSLLIKLHAN